MAAARAERFTVFRERKRCGCSEGYTVHGIQGGRNWGEDPSKAEEVTSRVGFAS